jgi:hypothetical protein
MHAHLSNGGAFNRPYRMMLYEFVTANRHAILAHYHAQVQSRSPLSVSTAHLDKAVGSFLAELVKQLTPDRSSRAEILSSVTQAPDHVLGGGGSITQVVHHYGHLCDTIIDLARAAAMPITIDESRVLDRCLDDTIAAAVTAHGRTRQASDASPTAPTEGDRIASLGGDVRERINTVRWLCAP